MATQQAVRRWIMTGAVVAVTVTGTIYGAQLKEGQNINNKKRRVLEATPEERIAQLESVRDELVGKKNEMERKIRVFRERRKVEKDERGVDGK